jgi:uncharacterized protein (TIGR00369 family)
MPKFDKATIDEIMRQGAGVPFIRELGLSVESIDDAAAVLRLPYSDRLSLANGGFCGQSLLAVADTAMGFALCVAHGSPFPMVTVDLTMHFLKPAVHCDVLAEARVIRFGRTMAFGHVIFRPEHDNNPIALAQIAYAVDRNEPKPRPTDLPAD